MEQSYFSKENINTMLLTDSRNTVFWKKCSNKIKKMKKTKRNEENEESTLCENFYFGNDNTTNWYKFGNKYVSKIRKLTYSNIPKMSVMK